MEKPITDEQVMNMRIALQNIEDFAGACGNRLAYGKSPVDAKWMKDRAVILEKMVNGVRQASILE